MNTVDIRPDGSRWGMKYHRTADQVYKTWGATDIFPFRYVDDRSTYRAMLRLEDGLWYYAHENDNSCYYSASEGFKAKTGEEAAARYLVAHHTGHVESAERRLQQECDLLERAVKNLEDIIKKGK